MEKQSNIEAVIFDFDGTLAILPINYDRMRKRLKALFSQFGIETDFRPLIDSISTALLKLQREGVASIDGIEKNAYAIIDYEELEAVKEAELAQGAGDIFHSLKERNIATVIVSRNGRKCINEFISKFNLPEPNLIVSREDSKKLKPHPEHIMVAMEQLKLQPHQLIIVGDSPDDIDAGKSLEIITALVGWSEYSQEQLNPDFVISDLSDLVGVIINEGT